MNIGSNELVTINELVSIVEEIAETTLERKYDLDAPKGVNGRNSDNTLVREVYGWEPTTPLREGMRETFEWVRREMLAARPELAPWPGSSSSTSTTGPTSQARAST